MSVERYGDDTSVYECKSDEDSPASQAQGPCEMVLAALISYYLDKKGHTKSFDVENKTSGAHELGLSFTRNPSKHRRGEQAEKKVFPNMKQFQETESAALFESYRPTRRF